MGENKISKIPVASHGLHKHSYNYPWLSSINFGDVMPCYVNTIRRGERDKPRAGMFSQLMPIAHNAFATGRFNFKAIFVPYKFVWRPWYSFDQDTDYISVGVTSRYQRYPYVTHEVLTNSFVSNSDFVEAGNSDSYDIAVYVNDNTSNFYRVKSAGRRVLRIIGALGCMPSWLAADKAAINILPILCYLKAFADYYFPNNYVGDSHYSLLSKFQEREGPDFTSDCSDLLLAVELASLNFYQDSIFDLAWDNPVSPNVNSSLPSVAIPDITNNALSSTNSSTGAVVTNDPNSANSPNSSSYKPSNGTPFAGGQYGTSSLGGSYSTGVLTKYVIDSLTALSLWMKRRQLSGVRLLDRFLVSRGISLPNDSARISYLVGQRNVEIEVSGVENTTDVNLGELAGRGVASSGKDPLSFECRPDDDGMFFVIVSPLPDANFPVFLDGFSNRRDSLENYHAEYDKLGAAAVPSRLIQLGLDGRQNHLYNPEVATFGFLSQYWDEVQERPRLLGDFILKSKGAEELRAYHTFRILNPIGNRYHSFDFMRMGDASQYQRLFYSDEQENLMLFLRWYGEQYKEKLPLGDSYDWDDDELNRKVSVVVGGSQK